MTVGVRPVADFRKQPHALMMGAVFTVGWLLATLLPLAAPVWCWQIAGHLRARAWIAHLLFVPVLVAAYLGLVELSFWASGDTGDGPPGLGLAFLPSVLSMLIGIGGYYIALAVKGLMRLGERPTSDIRPRAIVR